MTNTDMPNKVHEGRNIKRFREMLGIKQEGLAFELGEDWMQKKVSLLEQKETIDADILEQVAKILTVPVEALKNLNEESAVNIISNSFSDFKDNASGINNNCDITFNPIDKLVELYERIIREKEDKIAILEKFFDKK